MTSHNEARLTIMSKTKISSTNDVGLSARCKAIVAIEAHIQRGCLSKVLAEMPAMLSRYPQSAELYHLLGLALLALGQPDDASAAFHVAISYDPGRPEYLANLALALCRIHHEDEALAMLDRAITLDPDFTIAHYNRANLLQRLRRLPEALAAFDTAIQLCPGYPDAWNNRAVTLLECGFVDESLASATKATSLAPGHADAHYNRALALWRTKRLDEALEAYGVAARLRPDMHKAQEGAMFLSANMARWAERGAACDIALGLTGEAVPPWGFLAIEDRPDHHRRRAERWVEANWGGISARSLAADPARRRLRIGYFSADFHDHATMHLMGSILALHDHENFEIHAFSFGPPRTDSYREAAIAALDMFHEVSFMDDATVAALARGCGIDVAVDLKGHTQNMRMGIFAHRAAPVQVAYLGYPGTTGAPFMDYLIADAIVVPPQQRHHYSEAIVWLPDCYLATDDHRPIAVDIGDRTAHGLPPNGFVFCSFNNIYKISGDEFDVWMRLLNAVKGSVLWLLDDNASATANLRAEAMKRGIQPARLVFGPRVSSPRHLARHALADLCLDSFNCNAHTTAVDALWAGTPLLTTPGQSFGSRVAASLLHTMQMDALIAVTREEYEARAMSLAQNPTKLAELRARLQIARTTTALFDSRRLTRHLETAFVAMHTAYVAGTTGDINVQSSQFCQSDPS